MGLSIGGCMALGFAMALLGAFTPAFTLARHVVSDTTVPGFAFLTSLVSILAGVQLFGLGVIGEYFGRLHFRSMQRPPYVVRQIVRPSQTSSGVANLEPIEGAG
jgi:hypothetical protein